MMKGDGFFDPALRLQRFREGVEAVGQMIVEAAVPMVVGKTPDNGHGFGRMGLGFGELAFLEKRAGQVFERHGEVVVLVAARESR